MTEIEQMFNDDMALRNIYDADPLRHNDDEYRHQIVILVEVVNDSAPCTGWYILRLTFFKNFQQVSFITINQNSTNNNL